MLRYVALVAILVVEQNSVLAAPPPVRLTIDCGSQEKAASSRGLFRAKSAESRNLKKNGLDVNSICSYIQNSLPKTIKDGRIILDEEPDQTGFDSNPITIGVMPPKSFIPKIDKLWKPRLKVPKLQVPKLKAYENQSGQHLSAPRLGTPMRFDRINRMNTHTFRPDEVSSAEKMERVKKAVQKLLHVVKVLGKIDEYISERMKIIVEKIAQTFE